MPCFRCGHTHTHAFARMVSSVGEDKRTKERRWATGVVKSAFQKKVYRENGDVLVCQKDEVKGKETNEKKTGVDGGYIFFNNSGLSSSVANRHVEDASSIVRRTVIG